MSVAAIAWSAVSALGASTGALAPTAPGEPARVAVARDADLAAAGLLRPNAARVSHLEALAPSLAGPDRAAQLLGVAFVDLARALDDASPGWRTRRLGLALGTSSGGMRSLEELFRLRARGAEPDAALARRATYFGPIEPALSAAGLSAAAFARHTHLLAACAASTFAIGTAMRWLEHGAVDVALAGGYDALALLVAAGFEAIRATTTCAPSPFRVGRDGMALGEGAGLVALVRAPAETSALFHFHGFGAATDAVHVTAPDRTGDGLARAAERALADAGVAGSDVVAVSAHATATPFNDAMEARAIRRVTAGAAPVVQPIKAQVGHTLGAAGVLETIALAESLRRGLIPPAAGEGELDADASVRLLAAAAPLDEIVSAEGRGANPLMLKLSAAFGGANAALVGSLHPLAADRAGGRAVRRVTLGGAGRVHGAEAARAALEAMAIPLERRAKLDSLSLLACGAVAELARGGAPIAGGGILVGHSLATLDIDERFFSRIVARGGAHGEPRLFPATSPNVCAGHAAILFGLRGPSAAVSGGLDGGVEALALGAWLVASGDADGIVVVAVDEVGAAGRAVLAAGFPGVEVPPPGALAVWLRAGGDGPEVPLGIRPDHGARRIGHVSLEACLASLTPAAGPR